MKEKPLELKGVSFLNCEELTGSLVTSPVFSLPKLSTHLKQHRFSLLKSW